MYTLCIPYTGDVKAVSVSLACFLALAGRAEVFFRMVKDDEKVGTMKLFQRLLPDGSKLVTLQISFSKPSVVQVRSETVYSADGTPKRMLFEVAPKGRDRQLSTVTFDAKGASFQSGEDSLLVAPPNGPWKNPAEFWFVRDKPAVGAEVSAYTFSITDREFSLTTTKFVGPRTIELDGKQVKGNMLLVTTKGNAAHILVDDQGLPLFWDGPIQFFREQAP